MCVYLKHLSPSVRLPCTLGVRCGATVLFRWRGAVLTDDTMTDGAKKVTREQFKEGV